MIKASQQRDEQGEPIWRIWEVKILGRHFIIDGQEGGYWAIGEETIKHWNFKNSDPYTEEKLELLAHVDTKREALQWIQINIIDLES